MKFLRLEIMNLASLDREGGEVIDFTTGALGNSTIFSIVGPTGSGKSTILDAICLALYNIAPRYPKKSGDRNQRIVVYGESDDEERHRLVPTDGRNILTRGKKNGYSKLTFLANNGNVYRAEWHVSKSRVNYNDAEKLLYKLEKRNDGTWTEELSEWNSLPQIIGLDYEQFLRTVLIAQGSFANFLTAKEDERYQLLEKLIGCEDMYIRISAAIKQKKTDADDVLKEICASLSAYEGDDLTPEELDKLNEDIATLQKEKSEAETRLEAVKKALDWYEQEDRLAASIGKYLDELRSAEQKRDAIKDKVEILGLHDTTLPAITLQGKKADKAKTANDLQGEIGKLEKELDGFLGEIAQKQEQQKQVQAAADKAKADFEAMRPHINKARTIKGELAVAEKNVKDKETAHDTAKDAVEKTEMSLADNAKTIAEADKRSKEVASALDDILKEVEQKMGELQKAKDNAQETLDAEARKTEGQDAEKLQQAKSDAEAKVSDLKDAIRVRHELGVRRTELENDKKEVEDLQKCNDKLTAELSGLDASGLEKDLNSLKESKTILESENLKGIRQRLKENEPCPLCGAIHHPYSDSSAYSPVITELDAVIRDKTDALKVMQDEIKTLEKEKSSNEAVIAQKRESIDKYNGLIAELEDEWAKVHALHPDWPEEEEMLTAMQQQAKADAEKAANDLSGYNRQSQKVEQARKQKESAEKALNDYKDRSAVAIEKAKKAVNDAEVLLQAEKAKTPVLQEQADKQKGVLSVAREAWQEAIKTAEAKRDALKAETGDKDPDVLEKDLNHAVAKADEAVSSCEAELHKLQVEKKGVEGMKEAAVKQKKEADDDYDRLTKELDKWIADYNADGVHTRKVTVDDIRSLADSTENWESIRKENDDCNSALTRAKTTYENGVNEHDKHQQTKPADDRDTLSQRKTELEQRDNQKLVDSMARLQRYNTAREQMGVLHDRKQAAEQVAKEWGDIVSAIGTDGKDLRKIAQCYTLHFLIEQANHEILKFNTRYELTQVRNSLGIRVIDHDRADDIRDTTSLSGGETFIVSLGLALGLSSISSRNISFENLFIDEGFGTLDPDTLATVIDSLAMLQSSQGKKVGVISHTDTMSERITTQIRIVKNGHTGSSHVEVYP